MSRTTHSQTIASAKSQIIRSSNKISDSKKRIYKGNMLVDSSKISITNSKYRLILSITFLTNYFLIATCQELANFLDFPSSQAYRKNTQEQSFLTPQENLQQIMTHPSKTGLCPYCSHAFPKLNKISMNWSCLACGWYDSLFDF